MTRVVLVRHGETDWNALRLAQGQADIPLNDLGRSQAGKAAQWLAGEDITAVYSSDLVRAYDTAKAIADQIGVDVTVDPDLREIDQGEWEGVNVEEIAKRWPQQWGDARHWERRPGGESPAEVRRRCLDALRRAVVSHPCDTIAIVTHGGPIRWLSAEVMGYDDLGSARLRGVRNGGAVGFTASIEDNELALSDLTRLDGGETEVDDPNQ